MSIFNYKKIQQKNSCYLIAEVGVNHECSLAKAKKLIFLAKKNGAQAVKFQTYKAEKLASRDSKAYWDIKKEKIKSQYELFSKYDKFEYADYYKLYKYCKKIKIDFLSTPFDLESVDFLDKLVPAFKISSSDITNYPLLEKISKKNKPILLSTGASSLNEIKKALKVIQTNKTKKIVLMHCILNYPTKKKDASLLMIQNLTKVFPNLVIGYSDHTMPDKEMSVLTTAYLMGAKVIEKHFTFNKKKEGNDHYHSMDFKDLKIFSNTIEKLKIILGKKEKKTYLMSEKKSRKYARRGIYIKSLIRKNEKLSKKNLICLRPAKGISAMDWKKVLGKKSLRELKPGKSLNTFDFK